MLSLRAKRGNLPPPSLRAKRGNLSPSFSPHFFVIPAQAGIHRTVIAVKVHNFGESKKGLSGGVKI